MFISNNRASFHFRGKEDLLKHQKVSKYENDCRLIDFEKERSDNVSCDPVTATSVLDMQLPNEIYYNMGSQLNKKRLLFEFIMYHSMFRFAEDTNMKLI